MVERLAPYQGFDRFVRNVSHRSMICKCRFERSNSFLASYLLDPFGN